MGYCSRTDIENIISQSLTSATSAPSTIDAGMGLSTNLINIGAIGNTFDKNVVTNTVVDTYIQISDSTIDAKFSQMYQTPFKEIVDMESVLDAAIDSYNNNIVLSKSTPFNAGDVVILINNGITERITINEVLSPSLYSVVENITYDYPVNTRIVRVSYPKPIRFISARLAAANIYDKYFSSEVSPNTSQFGKYLRQIARQDINDILNGRTKLHGQQKIGRIFYNSNIVEQYDLPKGQDGAKDMGDINL